MAEVSNLIDHSYMAIRHALGFLRERGTDPLPEETLRLVQLCLEKAEKHVVELNDMQKTITTQAAAFRSRNRRRTS
jgi:hypothetical protein